MSEAIRIVDILIVTIQKMTIHFVVYIIMLIHA